MERQNRKKKINKIVMTITLAALLFAAITASCLLLSDFGKKKTFAYEMPSDYATPIAADGTFTGDGISLQSGKTYLVSGAAGWISLSRASKTTTFEGYKFIISDKTTINLGITLENGNVKSSESFFGLGCDEYPFMGSISMGTSAGDTYLELSEQKFLFDNLSSKGSIVADGVGMKLRSSQTGPFALCRTLTVADGGAEQTLDISAFVFASTDTSSDGDLKGKVSVSETAGLIAGKVTGGSCYIDLTECFTAAGKYAIETTADGSSVGGLFGMIENGSSVAVKLGVFNAIATSSGGNAGLLLGTNNGKFEIRSDSGEQCVFGGTVKSSESGAAGLIGENGANAVAEFSNGVKLVGESAADNLFCGKYAGAVVGNNGENAELTINGDVKTENFTVRGEYCGGLVGCSDGGITFSDGAAVEIAGGVFEKAAFSAQPIFGGSIGVLTKTLPQNGTISITNNNFSGFSVAGGYVGRFTLKSESTADNVSAVSSAFECGTLSDFTAGGYFGELIAESSLVITADGETTNVFNNAKSGVSGGVFGKISGGGLTNAVTISGKDGTFTITNTLSDGSFAGNFGGIIGTIGGAYLKADGIVVKNDKTTSDDGSGDVAGVAENGSAIDVGTVEYRSNGSGSVLLSIAEEGSILRLSGKITDSSSVANHIVKKQSNALLYADGSFSFTRAANSLGNDVGNYGQIIRNDKLDIINLNETSHEFSLAKTVYNGGRINLSSAADFALFAITVTTRGVFSGVDGITDYTDLLKSTISLTADIDLSGSGTEQLTRSDNADEFTGTIEGGGNTITLAVGEDITGTNVGIKSLSNERYYLGIVSAANNATVENLKIAGEISYKANASKNVYIGGIAGYASDKITVKNSEANIQISLSDGSTVNSVGSTNSIYAGGFIGYIAGSGISITDSVTSAKITRSSGYDDNVYLGGIAAKATTSGDAVLTGNTISAEISQSRQVTNAYVGGVIAELQSDGYISADMRKTKSVGAKISVNATNGTGGLVGRNYINCRVILDSDWSGTIENSKKVTRYGGLLSYIEGKIDLGSEFSVNADGFNAEAKEKGVILGDGMKAIVTVKCEPSAFKNVKTGFDLIVGRNISRWTSVGVAAAGGVVTIETSEKDDFGKMPADSDWFALINGYSNDQSRYYFNIAGLENRAALSVVSSPADLIYWNVYDFVSGSLTEKVRDYGYPAEVNSITGATCNVDMTDYCFYPTEKGAVTFDFGGYTLTFGNDKETTAKQFFGLHGGVFSDITTNDSAAKNVTFGNICLAGKIYPVGNNSGVFVCGTIKGNLDAQVDSIANVAVSDVFFKDLVVDGNSDYRPLLINKINSYVSCKITAVSQYAKDTYDKVKKTTDYSGKAASSLIGAGGIRSDGTSSSNVSVTFEHIVFASESGNSIFTRATLFDSINIINGSGNFTYNFALAEDWKSGEHINAVTYGRELTTNTKQQQYVDVDIYVSPEKSDAKEAYDFSAYLLYVYVSSEVLSVNRKGVDFVDGWGTYEHPYVLNSAAHIVQLSELLNGTPINTGWMVNYPVSGSDYTSCYEYTAESSSTLKSGNKSLSSADLINYLAGAYYKIGVDEIIVADDSEFVGIGSITNPFHGVISGNGNTTINIAHSNEIANTGFGGFVSVSNGCVVYGLKIVYGDITVSKGDNGGIYEWNKTDNNMLTSRPAETGTLKTRVSHFGGIIGWNVGGDSLIDSSSAEINGNVTAGHETSAFGGYVGFVSGGGVTLRKVGDGYTAKSFDNYLYYNPYVGKVLGGYVISNDKEYDNGYGGEYKNYKIPIVTEESIAAAKTSSLFSGKGNVFTLSTAEQLLMLGFASNNGAMMYTSNAIGYGANAKSRYGDYSHVGEENYLNNSGISSDGKYTDDVKVRGTSIFSEYFGFNPGVYNRAGITVKLTSAIYDMSVYKNAFRGFGNGLAGEDSVQIAKVNGISSKSLIKWDCTVYQYYSGSNFEADSYRNLGFVIENPWINGSPVASVFGNMAMSGNISLVFKDKNGNEPVTKIAKADFCVGAFAGFSQRATFTNVEIKDLTVRSPGWAGGLSGGQDFYDTTAVNGCAATNLKIYGYLASGGLFGHVRLKANVTFTDTDVESSLIKMKNNGSFSFGNYGDPFEGVGGVIGVITEFGGNSTTITNSKVSSSSILYECVVKTSRSDSVGGFIGGKDDKDGTIKFSNCTVDGCVIAAYCKFNYKDSSPEEYTDDTQIDITNAAYNPINNVLKYALANKTVANYSAGGLIGRFYRNVEVSGCSVTAVSSPTVILSYGIAGGVSGYVEKQQTYTITDFAISSENNSVYIIGNGDSAGLIGGAWTNSATFKTTDAEVKNSYVVSLSGTAGGLFGDMKNATITVKNAEVSSSVIASSSSAAGIIAVSAGANDFDNINVFDNRIIGLSSVASGVFGETSLDSDVDGLYLGENVIRGKKGAIIGLMSGKTSGGNLSADDVLLYKNESGYLPATASADFAKIISGDFSDISGTVDRDNANGLINTLSGGTVDIFKVSREEIADLTSVINDVSSDSAKVFLYAAYGASSYYRDNYNGVENSITQGEAFDAMQETAETSQGDLVLYGDAVTKQGTSATPDYENDLSWRKSTSAEQTLFKTNSLSGLTGDETLAANGNLNVLQLNGKPNDSVTAFLKLVTNGAFGDSGFTFTVESQRYSVLSDGKLVKSEGEKGSVEYLNGRFVNKAKFDNLTGDEKTLTVLTVTFVRTSDTTKTYTMHIVVYYPQILEIKTYISALEGEVYRIQAFIDSASVDPEISAGSKFSMYVEYAYNDVAKNIEDFNFEKRISSVTRDGDATGKRGEFKKDTSFILIDLNSAKAYGYKYYYYTLTEGGYYIDFENFINSEKTGFLPKTLTEIIDCNLAERNHICSDKDFDVIERYIVAVVPSAEQESLLQYILKAQVKENDKNIIVSSSEKQKTISVWGEPTGDVTIEAEKSAFSNSSDKKMVADVNVKATFPNGYINSMKNRPIYGTHIIRLRDSKNGFISVPAGTLVTVYDGEGERYSVMITSPTASVNYGLGNIIPKSDAESGEYSDSFTVSLDFSMISSKDFNAFFSGGEYKLQDDFYISGDADYYMLGAKIPDEDVNAIFNPDRASTVNVVVAPTDRKHLAVNVKDPTDTDDGEIFFNLDVDFNSITNVTFKSAKIEFCIYQKKYDSENSRHYYDETASLCGEGKFGKVLNADRTAFSGALDVTGGVASGKFLLKLDLGANPALANYRLVVKVTGEGTDDGGEEITQTASNYFVFVLCSISSEIPVS